MSRDDGLYYDDDPVDLTEIERSGRPQRKSLLRRFFGALIVLFSLMFLGLVIASGAVLWVLDLWQGLARLSSACNL